MTDNQTFIIVGAGLAGAKAAETLRDEGFAGRIVLIGSEEERPYERPPLSKEYLRKEAPREKIFVHPAGYYESHGVELLTGRTAISLNTVKREVILDDGARLGYDRLLIATGAEPRRLATPGSELEGVLKLRTVGDADAIRERLKRGKKVVVVGAGWIGSEVAASARQLGLDVTVVDSAPVPLYRVLGREIGEVYRDLHAEHGVQLLLGNGVKSFAGDGAVEKVLFDDGTELACDFVVAGVGAQPRSELAMQSGIKSQGGILVDRYLQTSAAGVYAAGDVAAAEHPFYGERIRVEHWANALNQGPAAARNMLGQSTAYERLPYFFSDQYDVGMEYSGFATKWDRVVLRGDRDAREFIAFWIKNDRVVAGMNMNVWDVNEQIQQLIKSRATVDDATLADPGVSLSQLSVS
jgi:3-phenylpropionate/trans-cinnamate dioxygenase ferredoxin reductase subunit